MAEPYAFPDLPVSDIDAGTTVMVTGPPHSGTRRLTLKLLSPVDGEGSITISTNTKAERMARKCRAIGMDQSPERTAIIDCGGNDDRIDEARVLSVSSPKDLTGIGMRYSKVYRDLYRLGVTRIRTGVHSVSTLLSFNELKPVVRFVHAIAGRVDSADGIGVLLVDPVMHDERTVSTLAQFCDGRIEVEERDDKPHLRARGLDGQPRSWTPFDPS
jgi:KaiC/GvpD/RAD55 family RecA-like ATPase